MIPIPSIFRIPGLGRSLCPLVFGRVYSVSRFQSPQTARRVYKGDIEIDFLPPDSVASTALRTASSPPLEILKDAIARRAANVTTIFHCLKAYQELLGRSSAR